jgi:hypothetical protein
MFRIGLGRLGLLAPVVRFHPQEARPFRLHGRRDTQVIAAD